MERRAFLLALAGAGVGLSTLSLTGGDAVARTMADFRTADLMTGGFALQSSELARNQARNPDVVNFAYAEIREQVQVAEMLGAAPGTAPLRRDHAVMLTQLQSLPPGAFERMYVQGQLAGHRELLALNTSYLRRGGDERLRSVAGMSVPLIQQHLAILRGLREMA